MKRLGSGFWRIDRCSIIWLIWGRKRNNVTKGSHFASQVQTYDENNLLQLLLFARQEEVESGEVAGGLDSQCVQVLHLTFNQGPIFRWCKIALIDT